MTKPRATLAYTHSHLPLFDIPIANRFVPCEQGLLDVFENKILALPAHIQQPFPLEGNRFLVATNKPPIKLIFGEVRNNKLHFIEDEKLNKACPGLICIDNISPNGRFALVQIKKENLLPKFSIVYKIIDLKNYQSIEIPIKDISYSKSTLYTYRNYSYRSSFFLNSSYLLIPTNEEQRDYQHVFYLDTSQNLQVISLGRFQCTELVASAPKGRVIGLSADGKTAAVYNSSTRSERGFVPAGWHFINFENFSEVQHVKTSFHSGQGMGASKWIGDSFLCLRWKQSDSKKHLVTCWSLLSNPIDTKETPLELLETDNQNLFLFNNQSMVALHSPLTKLEPDESTLCLYDGLPLKNHYSTKFNEQVALLLLASIQSFPLELIKLIIGFLNAPIVSCENSMDIPNMLMAFHVFHVQRLLHSEAKTPNKTHALFKTNPDDKKVFSDVDRKVFKELTAIMDSKLIPQDKIAYIRKLNDVKLHPEMKALLHNITAIYNFAANCLPEFKINSAHVELMESSSSFSSSAPKAGRKK